jgi:hypothetical protein
MEHVLSGLVYRVVYDEITRRLHNDLKCFLCWDPLPGDDEYKLRNLARLQR